MPGIFIIISIVMLFLFCEITSSIGMTVYYKRKKVRYPALVWVPILKYYYFSKHSNGFCPISIGYKLPHIILPIFYTLSIIMFFIGLEPCLICVIFFTCYYGCLFRGIYIEKGYKDLLLMTVLSACGFSMPILIYISKERKPFRFRRTKK